MKKLWKFIKLHLKEDFSAPVYGSVSLLLVVLLALNYTLDFEDSYLDTLDSYRKFPAYFSFYALTYYCVLALIWFFNKKAIPWKNPKFHLMCLVGLLVLSLDASLPFVPSLLSEVDGRAYRWAYKVTVNAISLLTVLSPLALYYRFVEDRKSQFYGLGQTDFDAKPYLLMLLIMLPILLIATTNASFLKQYPMYKSSPAHLYLGVPEWATALTYEFAYGLDFITVELLFRGFFVIGMAQFLGRKSVIAMAVIYCLLHFGKPAGEAISSIFGGYILAIFAYETRSIWGGILVHVGIAWLMELVSYLAKL
jgi:hypothetical protein